MTTCKSCLLNDKYPNLIFNTDGICNFCSSGTVFKPFGEHLLTEILDKAKKKAKQKKAKFDVLVPLSGGKDSTYLLYLSVFKYKLNVLSMTYDNGLLSDLALQNIKTSVQKTGVQHLFYRPDPEVQRKAYKAMLESTGDFCGACDIATKGSILSVSQRERIPVILLGSSPLEEDSFLPDSIQDIKRCKYILKKSGTLSDKEISSFVIFPSLNFFKEYLFTRVGIFGKIVFPLFYIPNPSDKEMGEIIKREMDWKEPTDKEYTKHFDCIAEPFTNYVRNKIYGYERRICQYSNMIRKGEITREEALKLYENDTIHQQPSNMEEIMNLLSLTEEKLSGILKIKPLQFENRTSYMNVLFILLKKLRDQTLLK